MKNKYIVFFKGSMVILLILLIVVGFSFGVSFSSFVYSSSDHRAVEMKVGSLNYKLLIEDNETNTITLKPGYNIINIKIESLNKVDSYYKIVLDNNLNTYYYNSLKDEIINKNEVKEKTILIFNNKNENEIVNFKIEGGYITNRIEDVKVKAGYYEINDMINIGDEIVYNDKNYRLLGIDSNGIKLLGDVLKEKISLNGSSGFNNSINNINEYLRSLYNDENIKEIRSINKEDVIELIGADAIKYIVTSPIVKEEGIYIPSSMLKVESDNDYDYSIVPLYSLPIIEINDSKFENSPYYNLLVSDNNYFLASTYGENNDGLFEFGIFEISNKINKLKLYDSENNNYSTSSYVRPVIVLSNLVNIKDID